MEDIVKIFGLEFNIPKVALDMGILKIHWYGVIIAVGFILAFLYCVHISKKREIDKDIIYDISFFAVPCAIVFARLYYVIGRWEYYSTNISEIPMIWHGGIAIYGSIIGGVLAVFIYCKIKKVNVSDMFDILCLGLLIGQCIGRWGNFVNKEAYGAVTNSFFKMEIYQNGEFIGVHPTFLYESVYNLVGFLVLSNLFNRAKLENKNATFLSCMTHIKKGDIFCLYLIWYGVGRFFIEILRTDSLILFGLKMSQITAVLAILMGALMYAYKRRLRTL